MTGTTRSTPTTTITGTTSSVVVIGTNNIPYVGSTSARSDAVQVFRELESLVVDQISILLPLLQVNSAVTAETQFGTTTLARLGRDREHDYSAPNNKSDYSFAGSPNVGKPVVGIPKPASMGFDVAVSISIFNDSNFSSDKAIPQEGDMVSLESKSLPEQNWRLAAPLVDVSVFRAKGSGLEVLKVENLTKPIFIRVSAKMPPVGARCVYLLPTSEWSEEGVSVASRDMLEKAVDIGPFEANRGFWCAATHLSIFAVLVPSQIAAAAPPPLLTDSSLIYAEFGAIAAVIVGSICSCGICVCCIIKYRRRPKAGCLQATDQDGQRHKFNFRIRQLVSRSSLGAGKRSPSGSLASCHSKKQEDLDVEREEDAKNVGAKIHIEWDVDIDKYRKPDFSFQGKRVAVTLLTGMNRVFSNHELDTDKIDKSNTDLLRETTDIDLVHFGADADAQQPNSPPPTQCLVFDAYSAGTVVEYYSSTHGIWVQGRIDGRGHVQTRTSVMPRYTVILRSRSQRRDYVELCDLRPPLEQGSCVSIFDEISRAWLPAIVDRYHKYPHPLAYEVILEHEPTSSRQQDGNQEQRIMVVPAHEVRQRFLRRSKVEVYLGVRLGWVPALACPSSVETWPEVAVQFQSLENAENAFAYDAEKGVLHVQHYQVRPYVLTSL